MKFKPGPPRGSLSPAQRDVQVWTARRTIYACTDAVREGRAHRFDIDVHNRFYGLPLVPRITIEDAPVPTPSRVLIDG